MTGGALALLRERPQFRALWAALALSYAGSGAAITALTLYVQETRGTGTAVAALLIAETAPRLLGPFGGSVADRVDLRRLMIGADLGQAALFALLALLPAFGPMLALVAMTAALQMVYAPARTSMIPSLVAEEELLAANGLIGTGQNLYVALGPLVGGVLFAAGGAAVVMLLNVVSFLASAWLTRAIPPLPPHVRATPDGPETFLASTRTGMRYAVNNPLTRTVTLTMFFVFAFLAIDNVSLVFLVRDTLDGGAAAYGVVSAVFGIGMVSAALASVRRTRLPTPTLYLAALCVSSTGALLTGLAPSLAAVAVVQLVSGAGNGIEIVASDTIFQQRVPRHLLGRVYGLTGAAAAAGIGVAMALGGFLVDATSPRTAFLFAGAGCLLVTAAAAPSLLRARP